MIFRINKPFPVGKFEFTCMCGTWNSWKIEQSFMHATTDHQQRFECIGCRSEVIVWEQRTHWHICIREKK